MNRRIAITLLVLSVSYICLVVLAIAVNVFFIPSFDLVGHLANGCYLTDALVIYVECRGIFGAAAISQVLTIPWLLMLGPELLMLNPIYAITLWIPLAYPVYYWLRLRRTAV